MATKILLNTVRVGQVTQFAGTSFNTVQDADMILLVQSVGGRVVDPTPQVSAAAALAVAARLKGESVQSLDSLMLAEGGGGGGAGTGGICWRPDGTGDAATWAEVMAIVDAANGPVEIWCTEFASPGYVVPANATPYDMKYSRINAPLGNASANVIIVAEGAVLHNLAQLEGGVTLQGSSNVGPCLTFTDPGGGSPSSLGAINGAGIRNGGTSPMVRIPDGVSFVLAAVRGGTVGMGGAGPIVFAGIGSVAITAAVSGSAWADGWLVNNGVDPTALCAFQQDGDLLAPPPVLAGFAGTVVNIAMGNFGGVGPTAFRPAPAFGPLAVGLLYYDTDLAAFIVWNGAAWVPVASGAPPSGNANAAAYFGALGTLTDDPKLLFGGLDPYGRPQIRDIREGTLPAANAVWRQGAWQVDGDATNVEGDGIVVYGKDPVSGLHDGANGTFARVKCDRFAIRLITGGVDVGYGWRVDLTEFYFKDNAGAKTCNITRATGNAWFADLRIGSATGPVANAIEKRTLTVTHTDLTNLVNGSPQSFNLGAVLPADARVVGRTLRTITPFTGGGATVVSLDVGGTDANAIIATEDLLGGGTDDREGSAGVNPTGLFNAQQLTATFTPDGAHNLDGLTAGAVTIDVLFVRLP